MNQIVGTHNIVFMTFDTLRYDVAQEAWKQGKTPHLQALLPSTGWELRHTPGSFTYAAHQAFFAGFLPTPSRPGRHPRLFAAQFPGSETTQAQTCVFETATIVEGLRERGYHTICIGGVGFFNKKTPLGSVFPNLFDESHWSSQMGVTEPHSTQYQFEQVSRSLSALAPEQKSFVFINLSALHQPNYFYLEPDSDERLDTLESHAAALHYIDTQLPLLLQALRRRGRTFCILCSDHGTTYGEDGYTGHRLAHPSIWNVPYAECILEG